MKISQSLFELEDEIDMPMLKFALRQPRRQCERERSIQAWSYGLNDHAQPLNDLSLPLSISSSC
eukprot:scaffold147780_cov27-Prasinocladus_malaysianus.AAC.1